MAKLAGPCSFIQCIKPASETRRPSLQDAFTFKVAAFEVRERDKFERKNAKLLLASKEARKQRDKARAQERATTMRVAKKHGFVPFRAWTARTVYEMLQEE